MHRWQAEQLQELIDLLKSRGRRVLGPRPENQAMVYGEIDSLPVGWGDSQEAARYRLTPRGDSSRFGYNLGPSTWKQFLFPPEERVFSFRDGKFIAAETEPVPMAFIGVRGCELAAIKVMDRVFNGGPADPAYQSRRQSLLIIAVNCSQAAATCFCASTGDGPAVGAGADLVLTEVNPADPWYLVTAPTEAGAELLEAVGGKPASQDQIEAGDAAVEQARRQMTRQLRDEDLGQALLAKLDHPHWQDVAERCLACGNCTQVCPTCFCSTTQEKTDPVTLDVDHIRQWDSCFTEEHSYVHGGVVHASVKSRYRQWLTHKLGSWPAQFGVSGCTGCGRCIAWCPVGIDLTREMQQLREPYENDR